MKSAIVFVVAALAFMSIACASTCTDSDGGLNYFMAGATYLNGGTAPACTDTCMGYILRECYCSNGASITSDYICPHSCSNGKCLICTDSVNGSDYYTAGAVYTQNNTTPACIDSCSGNTLIKCQCMSTGGMTTMGYVCPYGCANGACLNRACTDSDGGQNLYVKGSTTGWLNGVNTTKTDYCSMNNALGNPLVEYYCMGYYLMGNTYTCPNGCFNGACLYANQTCTDSDGGLNFYARGTVAGWNNWMWASENDSCSGNNLTEYYCLGGINGLGTSMASTTFNCGVRGCANGACNPATANASQTDATRTISAS